MSGRHGDRPADIRVVLAGAHGLLASIVRDTLAREDDFVVVAHVTTADALELALRERPDVVVTTTAVGALASDLAAVLFGSVPVPVVAIRADGRRIDVYGHAAANDCGLEGLTELIREAVVVARPGIGG